MELIGRVQRQQGDNRYYTCMLYIKVLGTPVYGFVPGGIQQEHTSQLGPHLSPVASRESSQTHLDAPRHDDTDCEVEEAAGGMCEDSQADGKAKALFQQQPSGSVCVTLGVLLGTGFYDDTSRHRLFFRLWAVLGCIHACSNRGTVFKPAILLQHTLRTAALDPQFDS